ncbi:hypothetical protein SLW70_10415 [Flavobacterium sp. NG2]|nr:hypothetical protein [Flavobacterium sp. NG2]WPR70355.1 hypothetical protein SLW70_10415 [Flavobacterium sp. NG2]
MKNNLVFDFKINKENHTVAIEREFLGNLDLVWKVPFVHFES